MNKTLELGTKPIGVLLAQYSIPAVIAMLVNAIYNVVDRIFIGQIVGERALAGLTITFPMMMIIFAFAGLIGAGGAALLSIRLGEKNYKEASHVFGNTLTIGICVTVVILTTFLLNIDGLLKIFGATDEILGYGHTYMVIILSGFIFQMIAFILSNFVRTEGKPMLSMAAMLVSAITNILLDAIFIGGMDLGVAGAAYGTILGQFIGLTMYLYYYLTGKSSIHLKVKHFIPDFTIFTKIITIGFTTFVSTIGTSIAMTFLNRGLAQYGGTSGVTSMGAINSLYTFFVMPIMGITQGMQPIIGYNHGAKDKSRVYHTLKLGVLIGSVFSTIIFFALEIFSSTFVGFFLEEGSKTIDMAVRGLRIFVLMLPFLSISFMGTAFFQSIARGKISATLGMLRQFIFLLPLLFILPQIWGLNGVWIATPIADALSILVTLVVLGSHYKSDHADEDRINTNKFAWEE